MAAISRAERIAERQPSPITLARLNLPPLDTELEAKETAARAAHDRIIRDGRDAWAEISRQQSFSGWAKIGAALSVGKQHCLGLTDPDAPWYAGTVPSFPNGVASSDSPEFPQACARSRLNCMSIFPKLKRGARRLTSGNAVASFTRSRMFAVGKPRPANIR